MPLMQGRREFLKLREVDKNNVEIVWYEFCSQPFFYMFFRDCIFWAIVILKIIISGILLIIFDANRMFMGQIFDIIFIVEFLHSFFMRSNGILL